MLTLITTKTFEARNRKRFFYLLYCIEYLIRFITYLIKKQDLYDAYKNISFEQEAYQNEYRLTYLENRKHFSWIKYIKK